MTYTAINMFRVTKSRSMTWWGHPAGIFTRRHKCNITFKIGLKDRVRGCEVD